MDFLSCDQHQRVLVGAFAGSAIDQRIWALIKNPIGVDGLATSVHLDGGLR
jgi:hypothetical protein